VVVDDIVVGCFVVVCMVIEYFDLVVLGCWFVVYFEGDGEVLFGGIGLVCVNDVVVDDVCGLFVVGCIEMFIYGLDGERCGEGMWVFVVLYVFKLWMIVFGVIDFVVVVVWIGLFFGYYVIVCDVWFVFVIYLCFLDVDDVVVEWLYWYL